MRIVHGCLWPFVDSGRFSKKLLILLQILTALSLVGPEGAAEGDAP
jgi:hypothetical protein